MAQTYSFKTGTVKLLREILVQPEWATTVVDIYNAGKLVEEILTNPPTSDPITVASLLVPVEGIELTDGQKGTLKKALKAACERGIIVVSPFATEAIEKLELL